MLVAPRSLRCAAVLRRGFCAHRVRRGPFGGDHWRPAWWRQTRRSHCCCPLLFLHPDRDCSLALTRCGDMSSDCDADSDGHSNDNDSDRNAKQHQADGEYCSYNDGPDADDEEQADAAHSVLRNRFRTAISDHLDRRQASMQVST